MNPVKTADDDGPPHVAALAGALFRALTLAMADRGWRDVRTSHLRFLDAVEPDGSTVTELSVALRMTKQAVGQFVAQLVDAGWVEVRRDAADARRRVVALTALGEATASKMRTDLTDIDASWAAAVGQERYRTFRAVVLDLAGDALAPPPHRAL
jgi:DNA-binding MarR family transcriptional regulator